MARRTWLNKFWACIGSFGLACTLLFFLFLLTFFGTFEQADHSLYEVQKRYFEGWFLITDARIFQQGPVRIPLPGGVPLMGLLGVNLIVGGLVRMRWSLRTLGIVVAHFGVAFMLIAALVKQRLSDDGALMLFEGEESAEYVSYYNYEVALWEVAGGATVLEHVIPAKEFRDLHGERSRTFTASGLPFSLTLSNYLPNCQPLPKGPMWEADSPTVDGYAFKRMPLDKSSAEVDRAGLVAKIRPRGGEELAALLWSEAETQRHLPVSLPYCFEVDGRTWAVSLRHERYQLPFTVRLEDFEHEFHPRTGTAKKFQSDVALLEGDEIRKVRISMNQPLRDRGVVLFQSGWGPQGIPNPSKYFSIFSVVRNPSDHWPLYACIVITAGLLFALGYKLLRHIRSQSKAQVPSPKAS